MIKINYIDEIKKRCKEQGIDIADKRILISRYGIYLDGESIDGYTESKDGRFICVPVYDDERSNMTGQYEYKPQCYEIADKFSTYLSNGYMSTLSTIWLLYE